MSESETPPEVYSPLRCSFCRKTRDEVGPLVEAPGGVAICYRCVLACKAVHEAEHRRRGIDPPG
jgi:hypothetical protein